MGGGLAVGAERNERRVETCLRLDRGADPLLRRNIWGAVPCVLQRFQLGRVGPAVPSWFPSRYRARIIAWFLISIPAMRCKQRAVRSMTPDA